MKVYVGKKAIKENNFIMEGDKAYYTPLTQAISKKTHKRVTIDFRNEQIVVQHKTIKYPNLPGKKQSISEMVKDEGRLQHRKGFRRGKNGYVKQAKTRYALPWLVTPGHCTLVPLGQ